MYQKQEGKVVLALKGGTTVGLDTLEASAACEEDWEELVTVARRGSGAVVKGEATGAVGQTAVAVALPRKSHGKECCAPSAASQR